MLHVNPTKIEVTNLPQVSIADETTSTIGLKNPNHLEALSVKNLELVKQKAEAAKPLNGRSYMKIAAGTAVLITLSVLAYFRAEAYFNQQEIAKNVADLKNTIVSDLDKFNSMGGNAGLSSSSSYKWKYCNDNTITKKTLDLTYLLHSSEREKDLQKAFNHIDKIIEDNKPGYNFKAQPLITYNYEKLGLNKYEIELTMC